MSTLDSLQDHGLTVIHVPIVDMDTVFREFGDITPIADGIEERGIFGVFTVENRQGDYIEVIQQFSISEDENGLWWNIERAEQRVLFADAEDWVFRELSCGNVDNHTWETEEQAWAALQDCAGSLTYENQYWYGHFEVRDPKWYQGWDA